jgi:hypothetical protein
LTHVCHEVKKAIIVQPKEEALVLQSNSPKWRSLQAEHDQAWKEKDETVGKLSRARYKLRDAQAAMKCFSCLEAHVMAPSVLEVLRKRKSSLMDERKVRPKASPVFQTHAKRLNVPRPGDIGSFLRPSKGESDGE